MSNEERIKPRKYNYSGTYSSSYYSSSYDSDSFGEKVQSEIAGKAMFLRGFLPF